MNTNEYLMHHGIKGQKWGVRRFQNPDGTRTEAGKKREKAQREEPSKLKEKVNNVKEHYKGQYEEYQRRVDRISKMSDAELEARIKRLRMEKELRDLELNDISPGAKVAGEILASSGTQAAKKVGAAAGTYALKVGIEKTLGKETANAIDRYIKKK